MPPCSFRICVTTIRPSRSGSALAHCPSRKAAAPHEAARPRAPRAAPAAAPPPQVVARLPLDDPLGRVPAGAAAEDDAEDAEPGQDEQVPRARDPAHQAAAVGRVAVGALSDPKDAGNAT